MLQRILRCENSNDKFNAYELQAVTSASYLAIKSLKKLAEENSHDFSLGSTTILSSFYVDDLLEGTTTVKERIIRTNLGY